MNSVATVTCRWNEWISVATVTRKAAADELVLLLLFIFFLRCFLKVRITRHLLILCERRTTCCSPSEYDEKIGLGIIFPDLGVSELLGVWPRPLELRQSSWWYSHIVTFSKKGKWKCIHSLMKDKRTLNEWHYLTVAGFVFFSPDSVISIASGCLWREYRRFHFFENSSFLLTTS